MRIEDKIKRKGLELGFTNVGIAPVRDYDELWEEVLSRPDYNVFSDGEESLMYKVTHTRTLHPEAQSVVCATLGFGHVTFPDKLSEHVARAYLSRRYTPPDDMRFGAIIKAFGDYLESLELKPDRNQFSVPQRLACAEAGIITYGRNNFAYTPQDGSFNILLTFLVEKELEFDEPTVCCDCPPDCDICQKACPTGAIMKACRLNVDRCILFNQQRFFPGAQSEIWNEVGGLIHGCDACQLACPRNREVLEAARGHDPFLEILSEEFDLESILLMEEEYYDAVVQPIMYNYIRNMDIFRRNAAVALGNSGDPRHIPALERARASAGDENVVAAIDYALEKLSGKRPM